MSSRNKRGLRVAGGAGLAVVGLGVLAIASGGTARADSTTGTPVPISVTVPSTTNTTISTPSMAFGNVGAGSTASASVSANVATNDTHGYSLTSQGDDSNVTATCNESLPSGNDAAAVGTEWTGGSISRTASKVPSTPSYVAGSGGSLGGAYASWPEAPSVSGTSQPSGMSPYVAVAGADNIVPANGLADAQCSSSTTAVANSQSGSLPATSYLMTDTFTSPYYIAWPNLSVTGSVNGTSGTSQKFAGNGTGSEGTSALTTDTDSTIPASSTGDTIKDTYTLSVPGNQAAASYQGEVNYVTASN